MKKIVSLILIFSMLLSGNTFVFADTNENQIKISLEKAIEIARESFGFNTEGFDFNQRYYENLNGKKTWELHWNASDKNSSINVSVDADTGDIIYMNQWKNEFSNPPKLAKYSEEEALKVAEELLKKLQPERYKEMALVDNNIYNSRSILNSSNYYFYFRRKVDDIYFFGDGVSIYINKNTLDVDSYNFNWTKVALPDATKAISLEKAKEIFEKENGIELAYVTKYDEKNSKYIAKLVYMLKNGNRPIDAITGKILDYGNYYIANAFGGAEEKYERDSSLALTPKEIEEIEKNKNYLSKENAMDVAKKYVEVKEKYKLEYASLNSNYDGTNASWNFSWSYSDESKKEYSYIRVSIDAENGEIKSLYNYDSVKDNAAKEGTPKYDMEQAKKIAEDFLNAAVPEKFSETKYKPNPSQNEEDKPINYDFSFIRMVNGIPCPGNYLKVNVNSYTGEITNYYSNWQNIEFPEVNNVISLDAAYDALYKKVKLELKYINYYDYKLKYPNNKVVKLVYSLNDFSGMLDPKSGKLLDYNWEIVKDEKNMGFDDIKDHWAENDILILLESGIIDADNSNFAPDENIKQKDFIKMLINSIQPNYSVIPYVEGSNDEEYEDYYKQAINRKIITEEDKNLNSEVSRIDAAKMLIKAMELDYIADKSEIFTLNYMDNDTIPKELRGYVAIATGLNIMSGRDGNYFAPDNKLTRAEAAATIVKFLKVETK